MIFAQPEDPTLDTAEFDALLKLVFLLFTIDAGLGILSLLIPVDTKPKSSLGSHLVSISSPFSNSKFACIPSAEIIMKILPLNPHSI